MDKIKHYHIFGPLDGGREISLLTVKTKDDCLYQELSISRFPNSTTLNFMGGLVFSPKALRDLADQLEKAGF